MQAVRVSADDVEERSGRRVWIVKPGIQDIHGRQNRGQRGLKVVDDKGEMLFTPPLKFNRLFIGVSLGGKRNGMVDRPMYDRAGGAVQRYIAEPGEVQQDFTKNVVFSYHFDQ